jgi:hypothetical protein
MGVGGRREAVMADAEVRLVRLVRLRTERDCGCVSVKAREGQRESGSVGQCDVANWMRGGELGKTLGGKSWMGEL